MISTNSSCGIFDSLERQSINQTILFEAVFGDLLIGSGSGSVCLIGGAIDKVVGVVVLVQLAVLPLAGILLFLSSPPSSSSSSSSFSSTLVHHPASYSAPYHMLVGAKCAACLLAATWAGLNGPNWLYCVGICMCAGSGCDGMTCSMESEREREVEYVRSVYKMEICMYSVPQSSKYSSII